jgi:hypothetical protein
VEIAAACEMMKNGKMKIVMKCVALKDDDDDVHILKNRENLLSGKLLRHNKDMMVRGVRALVFEFRHNRVCYCI